MSGDPLGFLSALGPAQAEALAAALEPRLAVTRPPYVIDTSVAVKWYIPEALSAEAKRYMAKGIDRHAPDYLPAEAASVVLKRIRTRDPTRRLTRDEGHMVLAALKTAPIQFHASRPLIDPSFALAQLVGSSLYDGLFLALAAQLGGQLVTADEKLFEKVQASPHAALVRWVEVAP
jgi:predicted nucleic acid-binding protein